MGATVVGSGYPEHYSHHRSNGQGIADSVQYLEFLQKLLYIGDNSSVLRLPGF